MKGALPILAVCVALPLHAMELEFPATASLSSDEIEPLGSYALPLGAWADGKIPVEPLEGQVAQSVWRLEATNLTTMQIVDALRSQLETHGYEIVFECDDDLCGGFDFRYGTKIQPEPEMHVDLGDYRFLSAKMEASAVSLMVSRSANTGFVQITHVGPPEASAPQLTPSTKTVPTRTDPQDLDTLGKMLEANGSIVLEDLTFETGTSTLGDGNYASLAALADYLKLNPEKTVALVGHTDAVGGLDGNIALSKRRAQAVAQRLIEGFGLSRAQISAEGMGFLAPRETNLTEAGREANRRVEVILTSTE